MQKNSVFGLGLLLLTLIVIGGSIFYLYTNRDDEQDDVLNGIPTPIVDNGEDMGRAGENINLSYNYLGDDTWRYMVTGTLPNPCYDISTEAIVMDSDPEQVIVKATISPPGEDELCPQVIQEVYEEDEFEAGEDATVSLQVD